MNQDDSLPGMPEPTQPSEADSPAPFTPGQPAGYWVRRVLAGNPFYLLSAALLLYGVYRVSIDPNFFRLEMGQLLFNYTSLQLYEILLVLTAIFLAARRIWYDSMLLVGLENLLVLVPLIVVSQAALLDIRTVWPLSLGAGCIAVARFTALKRCVRELDLPARLSLAGAAMLVVNLALPILYRIFQQTKVGKQPDFGAAYYTNQVAWLLVLPGLCALANVIPHPRQGEKSERRHGWQPSGVFGLWLLGSGVHLYSLSYVYDFNMHGVLWAPSVWVIAWTAYLQVPDLLASPSPTWRRTLLVVPLLATFLAAFDTGGLVFPALCLLNAGIFGFICVRTRGNRLARHLLFISLVALVSGVPEPWGRVVLAGFSQGTAVQAGIAVYLLLCSVCSRSPKLGVFGAFVLGATVGSLLGQSPVAFHWAIQAGLAFLLAHSLRWVDGDHAGASALRILASGAWVGHTLIWIHSGGTMWTASTVAMPLLAVWALHRLLTGNWGPVAIPVGSALVMLVGPGDFSVAHVQTLPAGVLAVVGSFLLFGLGTLAAVTKHRWLR